MSKTIHCQRVCHLNLVNEDFDRSLAFFQKVYGAEYMADLALPEWHGALLHIGRVIFEMFVPHQFLLSARYGPHWLGLEYQANMDEVREVIAERGIRIIRDVGVAVHTHPADCFGVAFEFYDGYFHDRNYKLLGGKIKDAAYWRDQHPLGMTGLQALTWAVSDLDAARAFVQGFLASKVVYEEEREAITGRAVGLQVADAVIELVAPTGNGIVQDHLNRCGDGIRSAVFGVKDIEQARRHLMAHGMVCEPGSGPGRLAVPADGNAGIMFEFSEI